jgi:hypothetical protein
MPVRYFAHRNEYRCAMERNQNGKYCVRIRADFGRRAWSLSVYFLASTVDRALKKLEQTLQSLQQQEERLWFWSVDRGDDPHVAEDLLRQAGLRRDRRGEFPRTASILQLSPGHPMPAPLFEPVRRGLAQSVASARPAAASD